MPIPTTHLGPFELKEPLGRGGWGEVWSAVHVDRRLPVAVKVLHREALYDPLRLVGFRTEVRAAARLRHPFIVLVLDHGVVDKEAERASEGALAAGAPYLVMELASGGSIDQLPHPMGFEEARRILLDLLDALAYAHAHGVVHRDIKSANVLLCTAEDQRPGLKLTDFGIAHAVADLTEDGSLDTGEVVVGTLHCMPPEQLLGRWRDYGPWTDLYAVGCLAWKMLAGSYPFHGRSGNELVRAHVLERPPAFLPGVEVPDGTERWLRQLLEKNRFLRFQRAADARWALEQLPRLVAEAVPSRGAPISDAPTRIRTSSDPGADTLRLDAVAERGMPVPAEAHGRATPLPPPIRTHWRDPIPAPEPPGLADAGLALFGLRAIPLVGREAERDVLWEMLVSVATHRKPAAALIRGPSGVGATRLAAWLCERAEETGLAVALRGSFGLREAGMTGLCRLVATALGARNLEQDAARDRVLDWIEEQDDPWPGEVDGLVGLLHPQAGEVRDAKDRYTVLYRLFKRLAVHRPLVVMLDDLHYGADGMGLIRHALTAAPLPVLFVGTVADEALAERPAEAARIRWLEQNARVLALEPLQGAEARALTGSLLALQPRLAAELEARSGGNAAYVVEVVGDWVARGALQRKGDVYALADDTTWTLPRKIEARFAPRLDHALRGLPASAREALRAAAMLGTYVDASEWERVTPGVDVALRWTLLERLFERRLAVDEGEGSWRFSQTGLRDAVLAEVEDAGRVEELHQLIADMLVQRAGEVGVAERLGQHLLGAGHPETALPYLLEGTNQRERYAGVRPALALLGLAEDAVMQLALPDDDERAVHVAFVRGRLLRAEGNLGAARAAFEGVRVRARDKGYQLLFSDACFFLDASGLRGGPDASAMREQWRDCVTRWGDPQALGKFHYSVATSGHERDRAIKREHLETALGCFRVAGDRRGVAYTLRNLAMDASTSGDDGRAEELHEAAMEIFASLGMRGEMALCTNGLAESWRRTGQLDRAERGYQAAYDQYRSLGLAEGIYPQLNLGIVSVLKGEWDTAVARLEAGRVDARSLGFEAVALVGQIALLAPAAARRDAVAWQRHVGAVETLEKAEAPDLDTAVLLEIASGLAEQAGWTEEARRVRRAAIRQFAALGRTEDVERLATERVATDPTPRS